MSGVKVTRETPAIPLPTVLESTGAVDEDNTDWPTGPNTAIPLDGLSDVDVPSPTDGDVLTWDDGAGEWVAAPAGGGSSAASDVTVVDAGGYYTGTDVEAILAELQTLFIHRTGGGIETEFTHAAAGSSEVINLSDGNRHVVEFSSATCALTVTGAAAGAGVTLVLVQDSTGGRLVNWAGWPVIWPGGVAPVLSTAAFAVDVITMMYYAAGTTWIGFYGATPLALGDTVVSEVGFGQAADAGASAFASRADHTHGTPDEPSGSGGGGTAGFLLLFDSGTSSPLVFADIMQADDFSDLLYSEA